MRKIKVSVPKSSVAFPEYNGRRDEIQAACTAGFNASPVETPPEQICLIPLLYEWFVIGQRAAIYVDHIRS